MGHAFLAAGSPPYVLITHLPGSRILNANYLLHCLTLWFSSVGIEDLFTAVLNRRLLYKSDIQPNHLKMSYSVGMFGPAKQSSDKQSRNLLLVNSDGDIIGATQIAYSRQMYPM
jgi:hypothetical protein